MENNCQKQFHTRNSQSNIKTSAGVLSLPLVALNHISFSVEAEKAESGIMPRYSHPACLTDQKITTLNRMKKYYQKVLI